MKKYKLFFLLLFVISVISCEKDGVEVSQDQECSNILYFENIEEFNAELQNIMALSLEEKAHWAEQRGFISIGVLAEEFSDAINPDSFNSVEEIENFVARNRNLIQLVKENGEYSVQTICNNTPLRFFMNAEGIFQIGEYAYKVLESVKISSSIDNINLLRKIDENNFNSFRNDPNLKFSEFSKSVLKSTLSDCSNGDDNTSDPIINGSKTYRTKLNMYPKIFDGQYSDSNAGMVYKVQCQVRRLGIWFAHKTTLYAEVQAEMVYTHKTEGLKTEEASITYQSATLESSSERYIATYQTNPIYGYDSNPYFTKFKGTAQTDAGVGANDAGIAKLNCGY